MTNRAIEPGAVPETGAVAPAKPAAGRRRRPLVYRHSPWVRLTHWVWVAALLILFTSGLQIFNAHPSLNFGNTTTFDPTQTGPGRLVLNIDNDDSTGITQVLGHTFDTTGVLGVSKTADGVAARAFPSWMTLPALQDLGSARYWHFLFAWVLAADALVYLVYGLVTGHLRRDVVPRLRELALVPADVVTHLRLRFSHGSDAPQYNVLQKLAYFGVLFIVLPVLVLAGLEMSPRIDAAVPWLRDLFGGRQSARTIHFLMAWTLVAFVVVHVVMVVVSGLTNNLRSMVTGHAVASQESEP